MPIYRQVLDNFKRLIYSGALKQGERIPSIRDLAKQLGVNPNTVQGQGSFISTPPESQVKEEIAKLYAALKKLKEELVMHGEAIENIVRFLTDQSGGKND